MNSLARLALTTTIAVYLLLLVGGIVSRTGSGLGCPDWPLCHGQLIPPFHDRAVMIEYSHRLVAALAGLLVFATAMMTWRRGMKKLAVLSLVLLAGQVVLGGITVKLELPKEMATAHLGVGLALFATLVVITAGAYRATQAARSPSVPSPVAAGFSGLLLAATVLLYIQMLIGGYVRHSGAGLACADFPLCQNQLIPTGIAIQLTHRVGALIVLVLIGWLAVKASRTQQPRPTLIFAHTALALVLVQILVGAMTVWSGLSVHAATAHLAIATAIFALLVTLCVWTFGIQSVTATQPAGAAPRESEKVTV